MCYVRTYDTVSTLLVLYCQLIGPSAKRPPHPHPLPLPYRNRLTVELPRESQPDDRRVGDEPGAPVRAVVAGFGEEAGGRKGCR